MGEIDQYQTTTKHNRREPRAQGRMCISHYHRSFQLFGSWYK